MVCAIAVCAVALIFPAELAADPAATAPVPDFQLVDLSFADIEGFAEDDHAAAFATFRRSCASILESARPPREAAPPDAALQTVCRLALAEEIGDSLAARRFFETHFRPRRVARTDASRGEAGKSGFLTGYYEPIVEGSLAPAPGVAAPLLARPDDLVSLPPGAARPSNFDATLSAARLLPDQSLAPYPDRAAIEAGAAAAHTKPIVWLRDPVEVFLVQVQGSARVRLPDGRMLRLAYAGRNGQPYTSIGRILVESGEIAADEMSLARLKQWIRDHGQGPAEAGGALMLRNKSYVFFAIDERLEASEGPIGGAGLTPLRSIAVDRTIWSYGLPIWIAAEIPWRDATPSPFRRLMIAEDTGSAIIGPARADLFFGSGDDAGARAGDIRHAGDFIVLFPIEEGADR